MDDKEIQKLIKQLNDPDKRFRYRAVWALEEAARNGQDITPAVPALVNALSDENWGVRGTAAEALGSAAENGQDITPAVPALVNALSDENKYVGGDAAWALRSAAENGQDITPAIPALVNALSDKSLGVREYAASVLTHHYVNKGKWNKVEELLEHKNEYVRKGAAWALRNATSNGQDITPAIPALGNALSDENGDVRRNVAWALTRHYANKGEWDKVEELLKHPDKNVRANATEALEKIAKDCESIEMLDVIQKGVENAFKEWKRKQPQEPSKEKIDRQIKTSKFIMRISKRKAELSKKDGELLLGDTVKKPKNKGKKMYREIRRVSRNG